MTDVAQEAARADQLEDALRAERSQSARLRQTNARLRRALAVAQERNQQHERELQDAEARYAAQQRDQVWRNRYWDLRKEYNRLLTRIATLARATNANQDRVLRAEGLDPERTQAPPIVGGTS